MRKVIIIIGIFALGGILIYGFIFAPKPEDWCLAGEEIGDSIAIGVEEREIHGEKVRACVLKIERSGTTVLSWESENRESIYMEYYKGGELDYTITRWVEDGKRCEEVKRVNNKYIPEGITCG